MKCESFSRKLFGIQKLTGLRGKTAKTIKKRFFKKILQREGVTTTCQKADLGSLLNVTLLSCELNDRAK